MHRLKIVSPTQLILGDKTYRIAIGKAGFSANKREGDNKTPLGVFLLREVWYRPDKLSAPPVTQLPIRETHPDDGWCDDPTHADYNKPVKLPFLANHEKMWREDDCYDIVVPLGYNDDEPQPGLGSAIFIHIAKPGYAGTEGCVALAKEDLLEMLQKLQPGDQIEIQS